MSDEWVKFHEGLTRGTKRNLSRATRFIYLELCLKARELEGAIPLPNGLTDIDAVYDLISGDRDEISLALQRNAGGLCWTVDPMVVFVGQHPLRVLKIPTWTSYNRPPKTSTERVKRYREKLKNEAIAAGQRNVTETVSETLHETRFGNGCNAQRNAGVKHSPSSLSLVSSSGDPERDQSAGAREEIAETDREFGPDHPSGIVAVQAPAGRIDGDTDDDLDPWGLKGSPDVNGEPTPDPVPAEPEEPEKPHKGPNGRYAFAYAVGMRRGIGDKNFTPPDEPACGPLAKLTQSHAKDADGNKLKGSALLAWFEAKGEGFGRYVLASGAIASPFKFFDWVNTGCKPHWKEPPPPPEPFVSWQEPRDPIGEPVSDEVVEAGNKLLLHALAQTIAAENAPLVRTPREPKEPEEFYDPKLHSKLRSIPLPMTDEQKAENKRRTDEIIATSGKASAQ